LPKYLKDVILTVLGEICGSVMLDGRFEDYLIKTLGEEKYKGMSDATRIFAMERWQNQIKPHYSGPEDEEDLDSSYMIAIPGMDKDILHMEK
jgi:hypothetical protein